MKLCFILGTRPEIIKLSPVIREAKRRFIPFIIIHTNQHYSTNMDAVFFQELDIPAPDYNLGITGQNQQGKMTAMMLESIEAVLLKEKPTVVFVQGDTNTVLAGALAATKLRIPLAHIEAGLRSYDRSMPEEINRILTDHVSQYLFVPTDNQKWILMKEGIDKKNIFITGNTIVDAVEYNMALARRKLKSVYEYPYILLTMHRPSNVDDYLDLKRNLDSVISIASKMKLRIVFPAHPRTRKQIGTHKINLPDEIFEMIEPVGFLEMLNLEKNATVIITDSGGVQEEACILGVPCVTLRKNTERPETIDVGANRLAGESKNELLKNVQQMIQVNGKWENPYGDGKAAVKILEAVIESFSSK